MSEQELSPIAQLEIYKKGIAWERARILKLLEDLVCDNPFCKKFGLMPSHVGCRAVRYHIALIKGEQK